MGRDPVAGVRGFASYGTSIGPAIGSPPAAVVSSL